MLATPSAHENSLRLMRSQCTPNTVVRCEVLACLVLTVDDFVVRTNLKPSEAMEALHEARRLVMVAAHDALAQLAATLATAQGRERA